MARFLLLAARARGEDVAPSELQRRTRAMVSWIAHETGAGVLVAGARIERGGVSLPKRIPADDHGSYFLVEADDLDAAIALVERSPLAESAVTVLPLDPHATLHR